MNFFKTSRKWAPILFISILWLPLSGCTPNWDCNKKPHDYAQLYFQIRDKNTHLPLVAAPNTTVPLNAPDSIRLKNITTNTSYVLRMGYGGYKEAVFSVQDYKGKAGTIEVLEFRFGSSPPDTLTVTIGTIDGWRGDECRSVKDPGITEVKQNGTPIYVYRQYLDDSAFAIKK